MTRLCPIKMTRLKRIAKVRERVIKSNQMYSLFSILVALLIYYCFIIAIVISEDDADITKISTDKTETLVINGSVSPKSPRSPKLATVASAMRSPRPRSKSPKSMSSVCTDKSCNF